MNGLLAGESGLLGSALRVMMPEAAACNRDQVGTDVSSWRDLIQRNGSDIVFNCVAHTDVESAETNPQHDLEINAAVPAALADACAAEGAVLVHFSSTGCYGDWKSEPYTEADPVRPTTAHHRSKIAGELAIRQSGCEHAIFRLGWLYGGAAGQAKNFVWKRLVEAAGKPMITSDAVQRGCPSFVDDVAANVLGALGAKARGTFNLVSQGATSRFGYVAAIVNDGHLPCRVEPGPAFTRKAKVSPNETAVNEGLARLGLDDMPNWEGPLARYVRTLTQTDEWLAFSKRTCT